MSWYAWSILWWVGLGAVLALVTNCGAGWRKWWVRVAALMVSVATVEQVAPRIPLPSQVMASAPPWMQGIALSLGQRCDGVGSAAGFACTTALASAEEPAAAIAHP